MAVNYEYVGTLKSGKHYVLDLDKTFYTGDEVPLTESQIKNFAHRFDNVRKAKAAEVESSGKADDKSSGKASAKGK